MRKVVAQKAKEPGLPPGTLVYTGPPRTTPVQITAMDYDPSFIEIKQNVPVRECRHFKDSPTVTWINVDGVHDTSVIEHLGKVFDIHPLVLEDIVNPNQRPKVEEFENHLFVILKMLHYDGDRELKAEQVSLIIGSRYVLSFQEYSGDVFEVVRKRAQIPTSRIRNHGPDYLAYALIDTIVDHYSRVIEQIGDHIENMEEGLIDNPSAKALGRINEFKRLVIFLRRIVRPSRDVVAVLQNHDSDLIQERIQVYLRDVSDHVLHAAELIEVFRDLLSGLTDLCLSGLSNQMNQVMKFLTIIGTIFIPLTFVAGIYGMNFQHMPELGWRYGYPAVWVVMVFCGLLLLVFFRRKNWL